MGEWLQKKLPPIASIAVILFAWQSLVVLAELPSHLLPSPSAVGVRLLNGLVRQGDFWPHLWATLSATLLGFFAGSAAAVVLALIFAESLILRRLFLHVVIGLQAIPKVALAPLIMVWLGFGSSSKVALVALVCFYPVFTSTSVALESVSQDLRSMMRAAGASKLHRIRHLDLPAVAGPVVTALQVAFGFALIGCVVMEFVLGTEGAGYLIDNSANSLDATTAVASMVTLGVIGATGALSIRKVRETLIFWDPGVGSNVEAVAR